MVNLQSLKVIQTTCLLLFTAVVLHAQAPQQFQLTDDGDTLNLVDAKGLKQGKWVISVGEVRGEPGYEEEGMYKNDKKEGVWRKYNNTGDLIAMENYRFGGKDGPQQYYNFLGELQRYEEWKSYNPDAPYDTIPVYGTGSNEIIEYKIVRAQQYSVPNGEWRFYEQGRLASIERYDRGHKLKEAPPVKSGDVAKEESEDNPTANAKEKEKAKPKEILEYEKKYSKKKRAKMERDGKTSL
jgi:hypothetical protein